MDLTYYACLKKYGGFGPAVSLMGGIAGVILGVLLIFNAGTGVMAASMLFSLWFIVHCAMRLVSAGALRFAIGEKRYRITLAVNAAGLLLGVVMLFHPLASAVVLAYVIAVFLLALGIGSIVNACGSPEY